MHPHVDWSVHLGRCFGSGVARRCRRTVYSQSRSGLNGERRARARVCMCVCDRPSVRCHEHAVLCSYLFELCMLRNSRAAVFPLNSSFSSSPGISPSPPSTSTTPPSSSRTKPRRVHRHGDVGFFRIYHTILNGNSHTQWDVGRYLVVCVTCDDLDESKILLNSSLFPLFFNFNFFFYDLRNVTF